MPGPEEKTTEQLVEEELQFQEKVKTTLDNIFSGALSSIAGGVFDEQTKNEIMNADAYAVCNGSDCDPKDINTETTYDRAFTTERVVNGRSYYDVMGSAKTLASVQDKDEFGDYIDSARVMADVIDGKIDSKISNDEIGKKTKEYLKTISSNRLRQAVDGVPEQYLGYKNIMFASLGSVYAALNASVVDNKLQDNISKWQNRFPIHQLVIDGGKQMKTMGDYLVEKDKNGGALKPEREREYRQKLYDQTMAMSASYDKMVSEIESPELNAEIKADKMLGNDAIHLHPQGIRGTRSIKSGLVTMKTGLENGWAIEDIGRLAAFHSIMSKLQDYAVCNGAVDIDRFERYDSPRYESKEQETYIHSLEDAWKKVEDTKLAGPNDRKEILTGLDKLMNEGVQKGYLKDANLYTQAQHHDIVRENKIEKGIEPAFHPQNNNIIAGEGRKVETILNDMNAKRTDGWLSRESTEHKNMRVAMEELQKYMKTKPSPDAGKEAMDQYNAGYYEKLREVKKNADIYKVTHIEPKTDGGKNRLRGAEEAAAFASMEMDTVLRQSNASKTYDRSLITALSNIDDMADSLERVDTRKNGSENFRNLKEGLGKLKKFSDNLKKENRSPEMTDIAKYNKLLSDVNKLADTYLENKKDINSDYARSRVAAVKNLKSNIASMQSIFEDVPDKIAEETLKARKAKEQEVLGDKYKLYDELNCIHSQNAGAFWGDKYHKSYTREQGKGDYSVTRSAGISVSVFALANTGQYSFEDIMDPAKLHKEKQEMFDKVVTAMQNPTPESQKWIAETIYNGQKATENMMNEQAKHVDFSKADISTDRGFCQMLHMSHLQFDAWQEMAHCPNEILDIAKKDHPEMSKFQDYKEWWLKRQGLMCTLNTALQDTRNNIVDDLMSGASNRAPKAVQNGLSAKVLMEELANAQKGKGDKPFDEWVSSDRAEQLDVGLSVAVTSVKDRNDYLLANPEDAALLYVKLADGTLTKNVSADIDLNAMKYEFKGFPSVEELKNVASNERFLKNSEAALGRLEKGEYKSKESFIEDSAYAMIGQMYKAGGEKLPKNKDGSAMNLEEYKNKQIENKDFINSLKSPKDPDKFISPKKVAETAKNQGKLQEMAKDNAMRNTVHEKNAPSRKRSNSMSKPQQRASLNK